MILPSTGPQHTETVLKKALEYSREQNIKTILLASTTGATAKKLLEFIDDYPTLNLVVVTHHTGFTGKDVQEFDDQIKTKVLEKPNCQVLTTSHALSGVERSFRKEFKTMLPIEMLAITLRRTFGDGTKVCMEIALMAADNGLVDSQTDIICIGGTGRGADTAWRVKPSTTNNLFDLRMKEIIVKPSEF